MATSRISGAGLASLCALAAGSWWSSTALAQPPSKASGSNHRTADDAAATTAANGRAETSPGSTEAPAVQDGESSELETTFWRADDLFHQGAFAEAALLFTKALELSQRPDVSDTWRQFSPSIAFNVAHSHRAAGNCEAAQMAFAHYEGLVHELPPEHVDWHRDLLDECPATQAKEPAPDANGIPAEPSNDASSGAKRQELSPTGSWLLDVNTRPTATNDQAAIDVNRVVGWSAAGGAALALGGAVAFWVSADSQQDVADRTRLWAEAERYQEAANTRRVVSGVLLGASAVLGGTSVYLLTRPSEDEHAQQSSVPSLAVASNGTNISVWGRF